MPNKEMPMKWLVFLILSLPSGCTNAPPPVTLTAPGSKFEPPVRPSQIPVNAWYCDMGTVHYAATDKGDGKCPICHMGLKHKK